MRARASAWSSASRPKPTRLSSKTQCARSPITNRMELGAYPAMVRARLGVNRAQAEAFEKTYYRHIKVLAEPADYGRALGRGIQPLFTLITNPPVRWFEPDGGQPVVFRVNPDGAPSQGNFFEIFVAEGAACRGEHVSH